MPLPLRSKRIYLQEKKRQRVHVAGTAADTSGGRGGAVIINTKATPRKKLKRAATKGQKAKGRCLHGDGDAYARGACAMGLRLPAGCFRFCLYSSVGCKVIKKKCPRHHRGPPPEKKKKTKKTPDSRQHALVLFCFCFVCVCVAAGGLFWGYPAATTLE